ncbi:DUF47 domain-containing protein [Pseudofrancisella aestuarii]|uniref:DUF47 domain-containing protein n=1 Tax=Pseudofrancisella aestuarii TaxID=2670347 RepID=A0ABV9TDK6_9GAMM|nr:DUF47 family protein [Pseudofrancisella aestuarii]
MLRKIVKTLIPNNDDIFFDLLVEASENVEKSAMTLDKLMKERDKLTIAELVEDLRSMRHFAIENASNMDFQLNKHFVTPIDRGELHNISTQLLKLSKKIVKIYRYIQILLEEERDSVSLYLTNCVETLRKMTRVLNEMIKALRDGDHKELKKLNVKINELDENVLEDLGHALKKFSDYEGDILLIMKIKDIYKAIESAIGNCSSAGESIMRVHVKEV